ncbi:MAG: hypothetical protein ABJH45_01095 [Paracoccaceae bacterium]
MSVADAVGISGAGDWRVEHPARPHAVTKAKVSPFFELEFCTVYTPD